MLLVRFTLLGDGTSDRALIRPLQWIVSKCLTANEYSEAWEFCNRRSMAATGALSDAIVGALRTSPCDLLFIHRDAEGQSRELRVQEINDALANLGFSPHVAVVPVRMTEAWLLFDEYAIRTAADNPSGTVQLPLPPIRKLEQTPNPKVVLEEMLVLASEKSGRQLKRFKQDLRIRIHRVSELITEFEPLRALSAFQSLEADCRVALRDIQSSMQLQ